MLYWFPLERGDKHGLQVKESCYPSLGAGVLDKDTLGVMYLLWNYSSSRGMQIKLEGISKISSLEESWKATIVV